MKKTKPSHIVPHDTVSELKEALARSKDEAYRVRLRSIIKIYEGKRQDIIAEELIISVRSVSSWLRKYNKGGKAGLLTKRSGRPKGNLKWNENIFHGLADEIDKGGYWSVPRMQKWIRKHHDTDIPEQTVWYRMDHLGYSYKGARPHPTQGNKEKQDSFKKGGSNHSWSR